MILPVILYGNCILRKPCTDLGEEISELNSLVDNLWDTLYSSGGVGLAAPQINSNMRVFIVDSSSAYNESGNIQKEAVSPGNNGIKETFINARIIHNSEEKWSELEGCLSIPGIVEPVERAWSIIVEYLDISYHLKRNRFSGYTAKIIQHEFDHTNGVLFIDHLSPLRKKLLNSRLEKIKRQVRVNRQGY